ncbi:MAG: hypothetical protein M3N59_00840 [bacterium]|nr:hypothetical protein [bacterium]
MPETDGLDFGGDHPENLQYTTKDARLLNQTETGIARAVAEESENFLERQYGRVYIVTDIPFTNDAYDVGEIITDTFQREFFGDLNRSVGDAFEHALTVLNQTLADLAAEGQSDWVGRLNAVISVVHENQIFVTQAGNARAYLVRGHSSTDITEGLSEPPAGGQTAKTFLNVAEGALEVGDKLVLATPELLDRVQIRDLRRTVFLHPPLRTIQKLAEQLTEQRPERFAAVFVELTTVDLISTETLSDEPNEIILSAPRRHFESLQRFRPLRKDTPAAELADKARKRWERELQPRIQRTTAGLTHRVRSWQAKRKGETPPPPPPRHAAGTPETDHPKPRPDRPAAGGGTPSAALETARRLGRQAAETARPATRKVRELWDKSGIPRSGAWQRISGTGRKITAPIYRRVAALPWRDQFAGDKRTLYRNLILAGALILVLSVALSVNAAQNRKAEADVRERIGQVEELQAKAEASFIFKDVAGARKQLAEARVQANGLEKEGILENEVAELQKSLTVSADRINVVVRVQEPVADFREQADGPLISMAQSGTSLYAFGKQSPVVTFNLNGNETTVGEEPPAQSAVTGTATTSNGDVLLLTDKPALVQLDTASGAAAEIALGTGGTWERGTAVDTVQQNAYILSPDDDQVWRHTRTLSAFNRGEPYFDGEVELKGAVDIVTGAAVHILKSDGTVIRSSGGEPANLPLAKPPAPDNSLDGATAFAINFADDHLFVADPKRRRVVEFNAEGGYVRQFRSDDFGDITDVVVDDKTEQLFVLSGNRLWQVEL